MTEKKFLVLLIIGAILGSLIGIYLGNLSWDFCPAFDCIMQWI